MPLMWQSEHSNLSTSGFMGQVIYSGLALGGILRGQYIVRCAANQWADGVLAPENPL